MKTVDKLTLHALRLKELNSRGFTGADLTEIALDQNEGLKEKLKNLCAYISPALFDQVTEISELLGLTKREIVEMAVIDFLAKSWEIIEQTGAMEEHPSSKPGSLVVVNE